MNKNLLKVSPGVQGYRGPIQLFAGTSIDCPQLGNVAVIRKTRTIINLPLFFFLFHLLQFIFCYFERAISSMLVKKGQNINIINLHDKTVIYTSRFVYIHQDSYIYIKIRIYT